MLINYVGLYLLQSYLIVYELVAANLTVNAATNIYILIPFAGSLGQIGAALLVKYTKRYKWIVVSGYGVIVLGMGLSYKYINGHGQMPQLVISQIILGLGQGIAMTTQFGVQAAVSQAGIVPSPPKLFSYSDYFYADMAAVTALYTTSIGVGNAIGSAVAGAMWAGNNPVPLGTEESMLTEWSFHKDLLPRKLRANLPSDAASSVDDIEGSIEAAMSYMWGTLARNAINDSYTSVMRTMLLVGLILVAIAFVCSLFMEDQNVKEVDENREYRGIVIGKTGAVDVLKEKVHAGQDGKPPVIEDS